MLCSCDSNQDYYIAMRIYENENFNIVNHPRHPELDYIILKQNHIFDGEYFLLPDTQKEIDVISITSDNDDIIEIRSVDFKTTFGIEGFAVGKLFISTTSEPFFNCI